MSKIITKEEAIDLIKNDYHKDEIEIIFAYYKDHPIELIDDGGERFDHQPQVRWVQTIDYENDPELCPNKMIVKYIEGKITQEEYMDYNRQIGYSLYGYWETFCFNNRFDEEQYKKDMENKKIEETIRNRDININIVND